jgi:enoyl-CoA hydratase/carnithine racemase
MAENTIKGEKKGNIFYLTINRPEKRNAISFDMIEEMSVMVEDCIIDPDIRVIILKGAGKVFSAGVDLNSLGSLVERFGSDAAAGGAPIRADIAKYQQFVNRLETIEIPIICAMHNRALGLGLEIALASDIRLMSEDCLWGMLELKFGVIADLGGTSRLGRVVGSARAMEILMTRRMYTAQQALEWGLVNYVYPEQDLFVEAEKMAEEIAATAPIPVGATKRIIKKGESVDLMTQLDMEVNLQSIILRSEDFKEGIQAMLENRKPNWQRQ